jgi:hypothetical protein
VSSAFTPLLTPVMPTSEFEIVATTEWLPLLNTTQWLRHDMWVRLPGKPPRGHPWPPWDRLKAGRQDNCVSVPCEIGLVRDQGKLIENVLSEPWRLGRRVLGIVAFGGAKVAFAKPIETFFEVSIPSVSLQARESA